MSTKILIGVVSILVLGGAFIALQPNESSSPTSQNTQEAPAEQTNNTADSKKLSGSFAELLNQGGDWQCDVSSNTDISQSTGTVYISGDRVRANFSTDAPYVGNIETFMIADGSDVYTWTPLSPQGVKATQSTLTSSDTNTDTSGYFSDENISYDYECTAWNVDESVFVKPDLVFMEV